MNEKRFIVESVSIIDDCNEDKSRIAKVITDTDETYSYEDLYEVAELLNEQQELIEELQEENKQLKFENETLKSNYQREIQSSIDFCNDYSKTNGELLEKIEKLEKENEQLRQELKTICNTCCFDCKENWCEK